MRRVGAIGSVFGLLKKFRFVRLNLALLSPEMRRANALCAVRGREPMDPAASVGTRIALNYPRTLNLRELQ